MSKNIFQKLQGPCTTIYDFTPWYPDDARLPITRKAKKKTRIAFAVLFAIPFSLVILYLGALLTFSFYETSSYIFLIFALVVILIWIYSHWVLFNLLFRHPIVTVHSNRVEWLDKSLWADYSWEEPLSSYLGLSRHQGISYRGPGDWFVLLLHNEPAKTIVLYTCSHFYKDKFFEDKLKHFQQLLNVQIHS